MALSPVITQRPLQTKWPRSTTWGRNNTHAAHGQARPSRPGPVVHLAFREALGPAEHPLGPLNFKRAGYEHRPGPEPRASNASSLTSVCNHHGQVNAPNSQSNSPSPRYRWRNCASKKLTYAENLEECSGPGKANINVICKPAVG